MRCSEGRCPEGDKVFERSDGVRMEIKCPDGQCPDWVTVSTFVTLIDFCTSDAEKLKDTGAPSANMNFVPMFPETTNTSAPKHERYRDVTVTQSFFIKAIVSHVWFFSFLFFFLKKKDLWLVPLQYQSLKRVGVELGLRLMQGSI